MASQATVLEAKAAAAEAAPVGVLTADSFLGSEPAESETPPEEASTGDAPEEPETPLVPEAPAPEAPAPAPEVPPAPAEEEGEEPLPLEAEPEAPVEPDTPEAQNKKRSRWKDLKAKEKELEQLKAQMAERDRIDALRAQEQMRAQEAARIAAQQAQQPQGALQGRPGVDRPYTAEEFAQLEVDDPVEFARLSARLNAREIEQIKEQNQTLRTQMVVNSQAAAFKATHADYDQAVEFALKREYQRWIAAGASEEAAQARTRARVGQLIDDALASGKNVAEVAYNQAVIDGWAAPQPPPPPAPVAAPALAPQVPAAPKTAAAALHQQRTIAQVEQGSVGGVSAAKGGTQYPTREEYLAATEEQIMKWDKSFPAGWDDKLE